ncbi:hypothetical protein [Streptomyces sp. NPDC002491]
MSTRPWIVDDGFSHELRKRRILPVISRKGAPNVKGLGKLRYVVEQTFALLHQFKRLAVRWERRTELHVFVVNESIGRTRARRDGRGFNRSRP